MGKKRKKKGERRRRRGGGEKRRMRDLRVDAELDAEGHGLRDADHRNAEQQIVANLKKKNYLNLKTFSNDKFKSE